MRRLLYLALLAMAVSLVASPIALAQSRGPSGADGTFNCADFDTQPQAQAFYDAQGGVAGGDPDGLDADLDGVPCETLPSGMMEDGTMMGGGEDDDGMMTDDDDGTMMDEEQYQEPEEMVADEEQYQEPEDDMLESGDTHLPDTGGPGVAALLLPAGLLLATGLVGLRMVRRRS